MAPYKRKRNDHYKDNRTAKRPKKSVDMESIDDDELSCEEKDSEDDHSSKQKQTMSQKSGHRAKRDDNTTNSEISSKSVGEDDTCDFDSQSMENMRRIGAEGMLRAKRHICEALDFGIKSGFLEPTDAAANVLRVSSGLMNLRNNAGQENLDAGSGCSDDDNELQDKSSHRKQRRSKSRSKSRGRKRKRSKQSKSRSRTREREASARRKKGSRNLEFDDKNYSTNSSENAKTVNKSSSRSSKSNQQNPDSGSAKEKGKPKDDYEDDDKEL